jgi:hypothetical protein
LVPLAGLLALILKGDIGDQHVYMYKGGADRETVLDLVRASADLLAYLGVAGSIEIIVNT